MENKFIIVKGARENNLKNIDIKIPKNQLVVITGLSGSGKSSLAFQTIYNEGRRRYVDSLSAYARQFLGGSEKPLVDSIEGLSPAISIEQKTTSNNPRSTVGTVTEIYDYLRLLYARIGTPFCPNHQIPIKSQTIKEIIKKIYHHTIGDRLQILAPVIRNKKGTHVDLFNQLKQDGFIRVRIDGEIHLLDNDILLEKNQKHNIEIVVDRIVLNDDNYSRISDSVEVGLEYSKGFLIVKVNNEKDILFSRHHSCKLCDFQLPPLEPRLFSFNSPSGACEYCKGLGLRLEVDIELLMPDFNKTINQGAIVYFKNTKNTENLEWQQFKVLLDYYKVDCNTKIKDLTKKERKIIMQGSDKNINFRLKSRNNNTYELNKKIEGVAKLIERRYVETSSTAAREYYSNYMSEAKCVECDGTRLNPYPLSVKVGPLNISEFTQLCISDASDYILSLELSDLNKKVSELIIKEIINRLNFLNNVGLDYLTLSRKASTLSGGESQRIRLATQIGSHLSGVLYVLDEPSIGLHQSDNDKLIESLKQMRDLGNTLLVVEHDEDTMWQADWLIDIGPGAGIDGGEVVSQGTPLEVSKDENSITGQYLSEKIKIKTPLKRRPYTNKRLLIKGARANNLKNLNVVIPLNQFIAITGVSGSGKSTLINEILYKSLRHYLGNKHIKPGLHSGIDNMSLIDKVVHISQDPIGRTPRSNPATYTSVFDDIRDVFASTLLARTRGYLKGRFSFNVNGGRCDRCRGDGSLKIEMHFLPNVYVICEDCDGTRYNKETLDIKYQNKNIAEVLNMTVAEALVFFDQRIKIKIKLATLSDVGLDYIKLGQSATKLSGGEAQRIKLATYLQKKPTGKTLYLLDEPTTGLHSHDVAKLITVLNRLVNNGDTVLVIEHNLNIIKVADHIIDLGIGGGKFGGQIVGIGRPEELVDNPKSLTGKYLKKYL